VSVVLTVLFTIVSGPVQADEFWNEAKRYSANLAQEAWDLATRAVEDAKAAIAAAEADLAVAHQALADIVGDEVARTIEARAAVAAAESALSTAKAALPGLILAAKAAAGVVAAIAAGTLIGEGVDWCVSWFWDPVHPLESGDPAYSTPEPGEIDAMIPLVLSTAGLDNLAAIREDFERIDSVYAGGGDAAWNFMHYGMTMLVIGLRGAAAATADLCPDVFIAKEDLEIALENYIASIHDFQDYVGTTHMYQDDPRPALNNAQFELLNLQNFLSMHPEDFTDPARVQLAIDQGTAALANSLAALDMVSTPAQTPQPLEGETGVLPTLTVDEFLQFIDDCADVGESALPAGEVETLDWIMTEIDVSIPEEPSAGPVIAEYVGQGDNANEADLFDENGEMLTSEILESSISSRWELIELCESPLWVDCEGTPCGGISLSLLPLNEPIEIPGGGGSFSFNAELINHTEEPVTVDIWSVAILPNQNTYGPIIFLSNFTIPADFTLTPQTQHQFVPPFAPAGMYTYKGMIGDYPGTILAEDMFDFSKTENRVFSMHDLGWAVFGDWTMDKTPATRLSELPSSYEVGAIHPNPFNATTTVSISLPKDSDLHLSVYNLNGQLVEILTTGWKSAGFHQFEFNADGLSAGIYFIHASVPGEWTSVRKVILLK